MAPSITAEDVLSEQGVRRRRGQSEGAASDMDMGSSGSSSTTCPSTTGSEAQPEHRDRAAIQECDITQSHYKTGLSRTSMPVIAFIRLGTFIFGSLTVVCGYSVCKLGEVLAGTGKAIHHGVYHWAYLAWLWSLGIFPRVQYDPIPDKLGQQLKEHYNLDVVPTANDLRLSPVIVCNHSSYLDGFILATMFSAPRFVVMASTRKVPLLGKLLEELEVLFVDRTRSDSRNATQEAISDHCNEWRAGDRPLLIFAEGTTSNSAMVIPFRKGAFMTGHPVRPSLMVYTGAWDPTSVTYRQTPAGLEKISDIEWMKQLWGHLMHPVRIRVLPPYLPSKEEQEDPVLYARNVRDVMQRELDAMRTELLVRKKGNLSSVRH